MFWLLRGPPSQGFYQHFPYDTGSMVSQSAKELIDPPRFILFYKEVVQLRPQDLQIDSGHENTISVDSECTTFSHFHRNNY